MNQASTQMKKSKIKQALHLMGIYIKEVVLVFGAFTLLDYFFFEEVMSNEIILDNLFTSPLMALFFIIMKEAQKEDEPKSPDGQLSSAKE